MKFIFKLIGWLFSNLFLIVVVVAACYAYVYWDDPFGDDTPAGKFMVTYSDEINSVKSFVAQLGVGDDKPWVHKKEKEVMVTEGTVSEHHDAAEERSMTGDMHAETETQESSQSAPASVMDQQAESESATEVMTGDAVGQTVTTDAADKSVTESAAVSHDMMTEHAATGSHHAMADAPEIIPDTLAMETESAAANESYVTPEIEEALNQLSSDGSVEDMQVMMAADKTTDMLIKEARLAYLGGDYEASIASYEKAISQDKENFDALGELGNVYFNQGDMQQAADAYYRAANIMVGQGQLRRAASLVLFLSTVDEEKAEKLKQQIKSSARTAHDLADTTIGE